MRRSDNRQMMQRKRGIKGNKNLKLTCIITLFSISTLIIFTILIQKIELDMNQGGKYLIEIYSMKSENNILDKALYDVQMNKNVYVEQNIMHPVYELNGIYYGENMSLPLMEDGRFFMNKEYLSDKKIAVVGMGIKNKIYKKDRKEYIRIEAEEYEVIGMVKNSRKNMKDFRVLIPIKKGINQFGKLNGYKITTDSFNIYNKMLDDYTSRDGEEQEIYINAKENNMLLSWRNILKKGNKVVYLYLLIFVSTVIFLNEHIKFWMSRKMGEIKIFYLCGASRTRIYLICLKKYSNILFKSFIFTLATYFLICFKMQVKLGVIKCIVSIGIIFCVLNLLYSIQFWMRSLDS